MKNKKEKYVILCPTWKRLIYKLVGSLIILSAGFLYWMVPHFWDGKELLLGVLTHSSFVLITRAGFTKVKDIKKILNKEE